MPVPSISAEKDRLRLELRHWREALSAEEHARRSDRICDHLRKLPEIRSAGCVHVFWPILARREVDVRPLIAWLHTRKKQVVLPVVRPEAASAHRLEHRRFVGEDALVRSRWGIDEPLGAEPVAPIEIDMVVVPALGVDMNGNRVGYGRGYYDAFLSEIAVPTVAPVFFEMLLPQIPKEAHDVPVDVVVTDRGVHRANRAQHNAGSAV